MSTGICTLTTYFPVWEQHVSACMVLPPPASLSIPPSLQCQSKICFLTHASGQTCTESLSPRASIFTSACEPRSQLHFSIKQNGRRSRVWCKWPLRQTSAVAVKLCRCRRVHSICTSPLIHLFFLSVFPSFEREIISTDSLLSPQGQKVGGSRMKAAQEKKSVRNSFYLSGESSRTYCMFTTC